MDYNSKLKELRDEKKRLINSIDRLRGLNLKELIEVKDLIFQKYSYLHGAIFNKYEEIYNFCELIEKNSTMSSKIFKVIVELVSVFEGEDYVLKRVSYHKDKTSPSAIVPTFVIISKRVIDSIEDSSYMRERYINHLIKNKIAIKIVDDWDNFYLPEEFVFYKHDDMGRIVPQISFRGFSYVQEFIEYIINYRIENNVDDLTEEDMYMLKDKFILLNVDNIYNNYKLKEEQEIREVTKNINVEYKHKQKILSRIVKKLDGNK